MCGCISGNRSLSAFSRPSGFRSAYRAAIKRYRKQIARNLRKTHKLIGLSLKGIVAEINEKVNFHISFWYNRCTDTFNLYTGKSRERYAASIWWQSSLWLAVYKSIQILIANQSGGFSHNEKLINMASCVYVESSRKHHEPF